jgi:hypothetical protein
MRTYECSLLSEGKEVAYLSGWLPYGEIALTVSNDVYSTDVLVCSIPLHVFNLPAFSPRILNHGTVTKLQKVTMHDTAFTYLPWSSVREVNLPCSTYPINCPES